MRAEIQRRVSAFLGHLLGSLGSRRRYVQAVAVIGSAARAEETWVGESLMSDIDIMVVTTGFNLRVRRVVARAIAMHRREGIDGGCAPLASLQKYRSLAHYEAKANGVVVWGQPDVFSAVRIESPADIPRWEGVRLLLNRVFEVLKAQTHIAPEDFAVAKVYEAIGNANLVFLGRYRPTLVGRMAEVEAADNVCCPPDFLSKFRWSCKYKLEGQSGRLRPTLEVARDDLLSSLQALLSVYTGTHGRIDEQMRVLRQRFFHPGHRIHYFITGLSGARFDIRCLLADPALVVWEDGIRCVAGADGRETVDHARVLLANWARALQIVV